MTSPSFHLSLVSPMRPHRSEQPQLNPHAKQAALLAPGAAGTLGLGAVDPLCLGAVDPLDRDAVQPILSEVAHRILRSSSQGRVLLIPPDHTRKHSGAGRITARLYELLTREGAAVDIMPALGTHSAMSCDQLRDMFGSDVPLEAFVVHRWKEDGVRLGVASAEFVRSVSEGAVGLPIEISVNWRLADGAYEHIVSIGQVVPHEVTGMSSYTKNLMVGCGGKEIIDGSHFMSAVYGIERVIGAIDTPARRLLDWASAPLLRSSHVIHLLTVNSMSAGADGLAGTIGVFCGDTREVFENAARLSQAQNVVRLGAPVRKAVVYLDQDEYRTTWLACKAIYRTRKAMADGGDLLIIAPGLERFGEEEERDRLVRAYGYCGRVRILGHLDRRCELRENLSVAAHLIHGSTDGRFKVTVACGKLSRAEIEAVGFSYLPLDGALAKYDPSTLQPGYNRMPDGEEIYFISNPALGLWQV